jgi:hypothetical protein
MNGGSSAAPTCARWPTRPTVDVAGRTIQVRLRGSFGAAAALLEFRDLIPRMLIRSETDSRWASSELDREMRREQREKWRREINDEILPSLRIEQMTGDLDATSRENRKRSAIVWFISPAFSQHPDRVVYIAGFFTSASRKSHRL